jgi:hypothetical protein
MDWKDISQKATWCVAFVVVGFLVYKGSLDKAWLLGLLGVLIPSPVGKS